MSCLDLSIFVFLEIHNKWNDFQSLHWKYEIDNVVN